MLLAAVAAAGCAADPASTGARDGAPGATPAIESIDSPREAGPAGIPPQARTIAVTAVEAPTASDLLRIRKSRAGIDTARGAGSGFLAGAGASIYAGCAVSASMAFSDFGIFCALGIAAAPVVGAVGMLGGGAIGAAGSEPIIESRALSDVPHAPELLQGALARNEPRETLARTVIELANERVPHEVKPLPRAAELRVAAGKSGSEELLKAGSVDGVLMLHLDRIQFVHRGNLEADDSDPKLILLMQARAQLRYLEDDAMRTVFIDQEEYRGDEHRVSRLRADDGALLDRELRHGTRTLAQHFVAQLTRVGTPAEGEPLVPDRSVFEDRKRDGPCPPTRLPDC